MPWPAPRYPGRRGKLGAPGAVNLRRFQPLLARRRDGCGQDVSRAVHPGMDGAHEVDRRARRGTDFLRDRRIRFRAREPGVALLADAAERVPAFEADLDRVHLHRSVAFYTVPLGDRHADVVRREAGLARLRRLRDRALGDEREGVGADLFRVGLVQHLEFLAGDDRLRRFEAQAALAVLDVDGVGAAEVSGASEGWGNGEGRGQANRERDDPLGRDTGKSLLQLALLLAHPSAPGRMDEAI